MISFFIVSSLFQQAPIIGGDGVYQFGESVTLFCGVFGGGSHNFTWGAPAGSASLERGTITIPTDMGFSTLTFEVREEDTGEFTCMIDGGTGSPATTMVTVGNAHLSFILFTIKTKVQYLSYSSSYSDGTSGHDSGV